jgi:DNA mismatch repair protein MutS
MAGLQKRVEADTTPMRRQYLDVKRRYPHAILFFRLGDFYETFDDDARVCARELDITLTTRPIGKSGRIPLAGVPHHAIDGYVARLIARGHKVAICDQIGEASARRMVERQVTRVLTPGTLIDDGLLDARVNNYLAAVIGDAGSVGLARLDASTGDFAVTVLNPDQLIPALERLRPAELIACGDGLADLAAVCDSVTALDAAALAVRPAEELLLSHFGAATLAAYACAEQPLAICAAAAALRYLGETQPGVVALVTRLSAYNESDHMTLDAQTLRNLEVFEGARDRGRAGSLVEAIDLTRTPMGGRLLRQRLSEPLLEPEAIGHRLDEVQWFHERGLLRDRVRPMLVKIPDLERLLTRVGAGRTNPREVAGIARGLRQAAAVGEIIAEEPSAGQTLHNAACEDLATLIEATLADEPPVSCDDGGVIRTGFSPELDALRLQGGDARGFLAALEQDERERTGIRSLRVGYNRVFGYYIEVSNAHRGELPADYERRQTLAGAERYTTPELKRHEAAALSAQEQTERLETSLFKSLCEELTRRAAPVRELARRVAAVDVSAALAELAAVRNYARPEVDNGDVIAIQQGRHPVVEAVLPAGGFVANDVALGSQHSDPSPRDEEGKGAEGAQILLLTGPNMAGKSTYLRQVALIVLLAQIGSFVPAGAARVGVVDRIFTRVGAQDDLAAGNSTFMVEMVEVAQILANATPRSLLILDEVGRGTSTYDGLAIAQAIIEYLHDGAGPAARTLFATHYHELIRLAERMPRLRNYNVAVSEIDGQVVFLRTIVPGGADRSYGIHVAQLAGLPRSVIARAAGILEHLETSAGSRRAPGRPVPTQLTLLTSRHPIVEEVAALDVDALSPLQALETLYALRERANAGGGEPSLHPLRQKSRRG